MTGYLKSLARRTVNDAPVLLPRLPSQFEPNSYAWAKTSTESLHHGDDQPASKSELTPWKSSPADVPNSDVSNLPSSLADNSHLSPAQETQRESNQLEPGQDGQVNSQRGTEKKPQQYSPALKVQTDEVSEGTGAPPSRFEHADVKRPIASLVEPEVVRRKTNRPTGDDRSRSHRAESDFPISESDQGNSAQTDNVNLPTTRHVLAKLLPTSVAKSKTVASNVLSAEPLDDPILAARSVLPTPLLDFNVIGQRNSIDKSDLPGQELSPLQPQHPFPVQPRAIQPVLPIQQPMPSKAADQPQQIVNVNIGRIEIKAVPVDERPRKRTQNRSSAMSLDDYLNQHAMRSSQ